MKGNYAGVKCTECKHELNSMPSNRFFSSLSCGNTKCGKWATVQGCIKQDNKKFFDNNILSGNRCFKKATK